MYAKISAGTVNHWVCGASATSIAVLASTSSSSSGSVKPSTTKHTSADATPIKQNGGQSSGAGGLNVATGGPAASSAKPSTGGAPGPMPTVQALLGVAGGLAGVFAVFL